MSNVSLRNFFSCTGMVISAVRQEAQQQAIAKRIRLMLPMANALSFKG